MECPKCQSDLSDDSRFCSKCGTPVHSGDKAFVSQTRTILKPMEEILPGSTLAGKYKIVEILGRGGMGIVYKAEDTKLKRFVALKFLPPELTRDEEARERFVLEARSAAALSHPNICTIHEIDEEKERSFIAMEYVEGKTLREEIEKGPLEVERALKIAKQIAEGLEEAHKKGIVHRDIKSSNIMVTAKGQAKVMDFGLAKVKGGTLLTREGTTLGTVAYMSPEQAQGKDVDRRSDIWALGVVVYEMLSGQLPFKGERESSILYSVVHEEPKPLREVRRDLPAELQQIVSRALKKRPESRYATAAEMISDLKKYQDILKAEELGAFNVRTLLRRLRKPKVAIPAVCAVLIMALAAVWFFNRQAKIRWAKQALLPKIEQLIDENWRDTTEPFRLALEAEKYIPKNSKLKELFRRCSLDVKIETEPPGADIYVKEYSDPEAEWEYLGVSPVEKARLPVGIFRWKMEKEGFGTVLAASSSWGGISGNTDQLFSPIHLVRVLDKEGILPPGMVRVPGAQMPNGNLNDFFMDKFEVTNSQYKEFVDGGGYANREYWKHEFIKNGKVLNWDEAMAEFVDQTGRPGPSSWQAGFYPEAQDDYPVSGISWYEAAAYAEFSGKSLPTGTHWGIARGENTPMIRGFQAGGDAIFVPFSNFQGQGPVRVGSLQGLTAYGAFDMAGNVREWCFNDTPQGKLVRGGAWNDATYMFGNLSQVPAFDRSSKNGFRCVLYPNPETIPEAALLAVQFGETKDFYEEKPVGDELFQIYKEQFAYDKANLNSQVEAKEERDGEWTKERISFDAAYGGERMIAVLYLPQNASPPYQTVIYFPGSQAVGRETSTKLEDDLEFKVFLSFIVKSGRAALYPVYKGTMERNFERPDNWDNSHRQAEYRIQVVRDFQRCLDYLETRQDIDSQKFAYYGMSWGAVWPGILIPAVEDRLKAVVLLAGGLRDNGRPDVHPIHYVPRVKTPTLMVNGKYDSENNYETSIEPLYNLLGTPDQDKSLKLYETDHIPPQNEFIKETLAWLDKYLGPVNR